MSPAITFRPLARGHFPLLQKWLETPHVRAWWNDPSDLASLESHYGPCIDRVDPTEVFLIEDAGHPIGWIQWYRWSDNPEHAQQLGANLTSAGIDLAIGELNSIDRGLGPAIIRQFVTEIVFSDPTNTAVFADPQEANLRSLRAFAKAGFTADHTVQLPGENYNRIVVRLDRPAVSTPVA
jgi:aminoglycoside 6'-N-acetyltransferase